MMRHFVDGFLNTIQNVSEGGGVEVTIGELFHFRLDVTFCVKIKFYYTVKTPIKRPWIKRHIARKNEMALCLLIILQKQN